MFGNHVVRNAARKNAIRGREYRINKKLNTEQSGTGKKIHFICYKGFVEKSALKK